MDLVLYSYPMSCVHVLASQSVEGILASFFMMPALVVVKKACMSSEHLACIIGIPSMFMCKCVHYQKTSRRQRRTKRASKT
jgi:hypothetical protein